MNVSTVIRNVSYLVNQADDKVLQTLLFRRRCPTVLDRAIMSVAQVRSLRLFLRNTKYYIFTRFYGVHYFKLRLLHT